MLCLTPIAPHSLSFRPIILPANVEIKIKVPAHSRSSTKVTIDGHSKLEFNQEDYLIIKKSPFNVLFLFVRNISKVYIPLSNGNDPPVKLQVSYKTGI